MLVDIIYSEPYQGYGDWTALIYKKGTRNKKEPCDHCGYLGYFVDREGFKILCGYCQGKGEAEIPCLKRVQAESLDYLKKFVKIVCETEGYEVNSEHVSWS